MNSFSLTPYQHESVLDYYKQWLARDLYQNYNLENLDDPNFLQKLSILQADGIRHDIATHAAITTDAIHDTEQSVGVKLKTAASLISSSLEDGFMMMNNRMCEVYDSINLGIGTVYDQLNAVDRSIEQTNRGISQIEHSLKQTNQNIRAIGVGLVQTNQNIKAIGSAIKMGFDQTNQNIGKLSNTMAASFTMLDSNISQAAFMLQSQLGQNGRILDKILEELRIPESQRERRFHIEEGVKYYNKGIKSGDCLYFEDALDEFSRALDIERKDYFSWFYTAMIYLYSKEHVDIDKALMALDRYIHYADALPQKHHLFDDALLMKAECYYLQRNLDAAYDQLKDIAVENCKAALRCVKYLSASTDQENRLKAVAILERLIEKNPFIIMQVLQDQDLVTNDAIIEFLTQYKRQLEENTAILLEKVPEEINKLCEYPKWYNKHSPKFSQSRNEKDRGIVDYLKVIQDVQTLYKDIDKIVKLDSLLKDVEDELNRAKKYNYFCRQVREKLTIIKKQIDESELESSDTFETQLTGLKNALGHLDFDHAITYIYKEPSTGKCGVQLAPYSEYLDNCIIPPRWNNIEYYEEEVWAVQDSYGKWGFINTSGSLITKCCIWDEFKYLGYGCYAVSKSHKWGVINTSSGNLNAQCQWDEIRCMGDGYVTVLDPESHKWGVINSSSGNLITPCQWDGVYSFHDDYALVQKSYRYGYINKEGQLVIPNKFWFAQDFNKGLAAVRFDSGYWGVIDKNGDQVTTLPKSTRWFFISEFEGDLALVKKNEGQWSIIDRTGKILQTYKCKHVSFNNCAGFNIEDYSGLWGYADCNFRIVVPCISKERLFFRDGKAKVVEVTGKEYYVDKTGKEIK